MDMGFMLFFVIAGGLAFIPAAIAADKGRDGLVWWIYGFFLFFIALIHSIIISPTGEALEAKQLAAGMQKCHRCAEFVKKDAKVCRFCQADLT